MLNQSVLEALHKAFSIAVLTCYVRLGTLGRREEGENGDNLLLHTFTPRNVDCITFFNVLFSFYTL